MASFGHELKQVVRRLGRTPAFTAITLVTLAIGIGANTAIFSVVNGVLLKPLPYPHAEQLVGLWHKAAIDNQAWNMSASCYFVYREQNHSFEDVGLYDPDQVNVSNGREPERVFSLDVTDGVLPILGVPPMQGRWFTRADDSPGNPATAILGYGYWQREFGGSRSAIGRTITIGGMPRQIIGVMPKNFHFLDVGDPAVFLPLQLDRNKTYLGGFHYGGLARLRPGVTLAQANADVGSMLANVLRAFPPPPGYGIDLFEQDRLAPALDPLKQDVVGDIGNLLWILLGCVGAVLLIACANVANLLLVRVEGRQQELAIRAALGAGRRRIAGEFLLESAVLSVLASVLGIALTYGALRLLVVMAPQGLPRLQEIGLDFRVLLFTLLVALLASMLTGLIPIVKYAGMRTGTGLREGGRSLSPGRERHHARNSLVVAQVGLAFVLLICSGLMIRTFYELTQVSPGFSAPASIQTFRVSIPEAEVRDPEGVVRMQQAIEEKIAAIPGVSSAAMTWSAPLDGNSWHDQIFAKDRDYTQGETPPFLRFEFASPGLFHTLGIPVVAGRDFTWTDTYGKHQAAIVSENFARQAWGNPTNALGKEIRAGTSDPWREIVGVVGSVHSEGMNQEAPNSVYWPILVSQFEGGTGVDARRDLAYVVRTARAGSQSFMNEIHDAVWSVDAGLPLADVRTLAYFYRRSMARSSFTLVMLGIAGAAGLLLGIVGLYGVIAYSVAQRRKEIGIRMALGAQRDALVRMFVRQGLVLTSLGIICGLAAAAGLTRVMTSLLFHVSGFDPLTYGAVSVGFVATAALASYLPARRASNIDPVETLRAE
jgi:predicted permease